MILSSAHTHCSFCDGKNTAEEMVQAAIALGFNALGFSSHSYCDLYRVGVGNNNITQYAAELSRLREKYYSQIAIYIGIELEYNSEKINYDFDYVLGSVHYVLGRDGKYYSVDSAKEEFQDALNHGFNGDSDALCAAYYAEIDKMITQLKPDICGHLDLIRCKNGTDEIVNTKTDAYKSAVLSLLKKHCKSVIFEVNTGGMARGYQNTPYPEDWILKELCKMGGKVMINSDSHETATLNTGYELALQMVKDAGFTTVYALGAHGIEEFAI